MDSVESSAESYQLRLFNQLPIYTTRLVREHEITYEERIKVRTPADAAKFLQRYFKHHDCEEFVVLLLDTAGTIIGLARISIGGLAGSIVEPRQVFKAAILGNAASIILAHNHPSGNPEPSREDIAITKQLVEAGKILGVPVNDHIIILHRGYTSLADRGLV